MLAIDRFEHARKAVQTAISNYESLKYTSIFEGMDLATLIVESLDDEGLFQ